MGRAHINKFAPHKQDVWLSFKKYKPGFHPTPLAYQGRFLNNVAQHNFYTKSARYGSAMIRTYNPAVGYLVRLAALFLVAQVSTVPIDLLQLSVRSSRTPR